MADDVQALRQAVERLAPDATAEEVDIWVSRIGVTHVFHNAAALHSSRRGTKPALKNLADLNKKLVKVFCAIGELRADEILALRPTWQTDMLMQIKEINDKVVAAYREMESRRSRKSRTGRPPDMLALALAKAAGEVFRDATEAQPARSRNPATDRPGPFKTFLRDVFDVLGVEVSTEHFARELVEKTTK